ncbi:MAG: hypothetical protein HIU93_03315 [Acidobacteria bacterium]|nr:hypothetical protein [Acidobacteriota bacterium]MBW4044459.1 hypothetical protein [Acidobacteriota bacterium]
MQQTLSRRSQLQQSLWWLIFLLATTHFCLAYIQNDRLFLSPLDAYMQGHAMLPYQSRVLMAWVLNATATLPALARLAAHLPDKLSNPRMLVLFISSWVSLAGSALFAWRVLVRLTGNEEYSRWASLLVIYMAYFQFPLVFGLDFLLPYDLPSLLFFSACIYAVICDRMWLFYPAFFVGTFNRETICMATLFLVLWRWQQISQNRKHQLILAAHVAAQAALWLAVKLYLRHKFANNPIEHGSEHFYYKLAYNLRELSKPQQWPVIFSIFGFTTPLVLGWRRAMQNPAMEAGIYMAAAWVVVMLLVGVVVEIRVFTELIAYMAPAAGLILYRKFFSPTKLHGGL